MRDIKGRAYDILHKIDAYVKTYSGELDNPRRKYMRDMILGTIRSSSLILSQIGQKTQGIIDRCKNSRDTDNSGLVGYTEAIWQEAAGLKERP